MSKAITPQISKRVNAMILDVIGDHASLRDARVAGLYVIPVRDRVVEMCMPLVQRTVSSVIKRLPETSRVEADDLFQVASLGALEAIDRFEPRRGVQVQTVLWSWMRMRINRERDMQHWVIMRPPHKDIIKFMSGQMTPLEQELYLAKYILPSEVDHG